MQVFISILLLITLALIATSPRLRRLRRSRPLSMALSGGWLAIATGVLLGPVGIGVVGEGVVQRATPLILVALGWVGLMIGLQARRDVLRRLPRVVTRIALVDALVSLVAFGVIGWLFLTWRLPDVDHLARLGPMALLIAAGVGWTMETRSLGGGASPDAGRIAFVIRGAGGVGAILAVAFFGLLAALPHLEPDGTLTLDWLNLGIKLLAAAGLAFALGVIARFGISIAGRDRSQLLVVFLGVVALVAGLAADLGLSVLFVAMLTGVVVTNLAGRETRRFERFIVEAEHVFAVLFAMLAGVLMDVAIGWWGLGLAVTIAATRLALKPVAFGLAARGELPSQRQATALQRLAVVRQSPVAIALAVGLIFAQGGVIDRQLLSVVVVAGLIAEAPPLVAVLLGGVRDRVEGAALSGAAGEGGAA